MEDQKLLTKDEFKKIVGGALGVSAMLFVVGYLESGSIASGLFWKIIRRLGIAGIGIATMQIVDKYTQEYIDEYVTCYNETFKSVSEK